MEVKKTDLAQAAISIGRMESVVDDPVEYQIRAMKYAKLGKLEKQIVLVDNEETKHEEDYQLDSNRQAIEIRKADHRAKRT